MMRFLNKYRFNIILVLLLTLLSFWFNPTQEHLYLNTDFSTLEKNSRIALLCTMVVVAVIILTIALKKVKRVSEFGSVLLGMAVSSLAVYLVFNVIFLSVFLALNRIDSSVRFEKKYTTGFLLEADKRTPVIYDFRTRRTVSVDKIKDIDKLEGLNIGDTVTISFRKGLLGVPFEPIVK